jgi:hypothetical protein
MTDKQIPWEKIPSKLQAVLVMLYPAGSFLTEEVTIKIRRGVGNEIMQAMKTEQERAWEARIETRYRDMTGDSYESIRSIEYFETWYNNTYKL